MQWKEKFPPDRQPSMDEIADYIGGEARQCWQTLFDHLQTTYRVQPKLSYSDCASKPGWNIKLQKGGQSLGTLYPEEGSFSVFLVISYRLAPRMEPIVPRLSDKTAELYRQAGDYMHLGKWMMFQIKDMAGVGDYEQLISVKLPAKAA